MKLQNRLRWRGLTAASALAVSALALAACGMRAGGPAPLVNGNEATAGTPAQVTVARGQTLSGIAASHHVPMSVLADANHLAPPYRILTGQVLLIPGGGEPEPSASTLAMAAPNPPPSPPVAAPLAAPPQAAPGPRIATSSPPSDRAIPLDRPAPTALASPPPVERAGPALAPPPSPPAAGSQGLSSSSSSAAPATAGTLEPPGDRRAPPPAPSASAAAPAPGRMAAAEPPSAAPQHGSDFLWPVRGHILEGYGVGPDGTHNDGVNIAAPRGAAVQATDGGVVAYAGNELRGYGNLILIKHPNGFISAYAHCDLILVKTGQKVARGQVIARVGATGNVSEPQLHFELRRGKTPVDPKAYLPPLPSAAGKQAHTG